MQGWDGQNQSPIDLPLVDKLPVLTNGATIEFCKAGTEMAVDKNYVALSPRTLTKDLA